MDFFQKKNRCTAVKVSSDLIFLAKVSWGSMKQMRWTIEKNAWKTSLSGWWLNQPIWKILVKLDHFPNFRVENKKYLKLPPPSFPFGARRQILRAFGAVENFQGVNQCWRIKAPHSFTFKRSTGLDVPRSRIIFSAVFVEKFLGLKTTWKNPPQGGPREPIVNTITLINGLKEK